MSSLATQPGPAPALTHNAVADSRRVGKASYSSMLEGGDDPPGQSGNDRSATKRERRACQTGTVQYAPLWNGPRLRPAFVAQVLGQVMTAHQPQGAGLALLAYGRSVSQVSSALLLDHKI
jgi:hypothetical protein